MPTRPDIDQPTVTFLCEGCDKEFEIDGTLINTGDGFDFMPVNGQTATPSCLNDQGDDDWHEVSLPTDRSTL